MCWNFAISKYLGLALNLNRRERVGVQVQQWKGGDCSYKRLKPKACKTACG